MVSFRRSPGSEHGVGVMLDVGCSRITSWSYFYRPCFAFSSRSHLRMLATIYASRLLQLHLIHFTFPISLNSLDREGVRLVSPCDSQILPKPACRCRWYRAGDATELKEELYEDLVHCVVSFQLISSGAQLGRSGICSIRGSLLLFWFHSRTLFVSGWCNVIFMYCVKWRL